MPNLTVQHVTHIADLAQDDVRAWEQCMDESHGSFFQSPFWVMRWWRYFAKENTLSLYFVREKNKRITAVFPGVIIHKKWWGKQVRSLTFIGGTLNETNEISCVPDRPESLALIHQAILQGQRKYWDIMHVKEVPLGSRFFDIVTDHRVAGHSESAFSVRRPCIFKSDQHQSREIVNPLPSLSKKDINQRFVALQRHYDVQITLTHERQETKQLIDQFSTMYKQRSGDTGYASPLENVTQRLLFAELAAVSEGSYLAHIATLTIPSGHIAFVYWLETPTCRTYFSNTFNPSYAAFSPSSILMRELIRDFIDSKQTSFDFGRGEMPYKKRFANASIENMEYLIAPPYPFRSRLTHLAWRVKPLVMHAPVALNVLKNMKNNVFPYV